MTRKKYIILLIIIFLLIFFINIAYKTVKTGNNIIKSTDNIIEYILNISSYEAKAEVIINSNKTSNKYVLKQYYKNSNYAKQVIEEPKTLENLEIVYNNNTLEIKNTNLGISKIYENYTYLNENVLWLNFIIDVCNNSKYEVEENDKEIILKFNIEKYDYNGKLYVDRSNYLPTKIEILDNSKNNKIYIEYKEIILNNIQENNIFVFEKNKEKV